jgi:hypothetical protein
MNIKLTVLSGFLIATLAGCGGGNTSSDNVETEVPVDQPVETVAVTSGKYKIQSGIVSLDVDAMGMKNKKKIYFDDFGAKERVEEYNEDGTIREIRVSDGKKRYTLFPANKTAYFADDNGSIGWEMEFTSWDRIQQQSNWEKTYKKAPNMTIAGKDCESFVYSENNTFAGWNGITLYHQQGKSITIKANSLEENASIAADQFTVPADFTVVSR